MEDVAINFTKLSAVCHEMSMISNGVIESEHDNRIGLKSFKKFYVEELYLLAQMQKEATETLCYFSNIYSNFDISKSS